MRFFMLLVLAVTCLGAFADNLQGTALASSVQTATTVNSADLTNTNWKGAHVVVNVSAYTSGTYTPHIQGKDPISGAYYDILVGPAIGAAGATVLKVYPGITATANQSASDILPQTWRVELVGATTPSMTVSVGFNLQN